MLAFPLAGLAARGLAGPVDAVWAAVLAGAVAGPVIWAQAVSGLGIGTAQWWLLRGLVDGSLLWISATAAARSGLRDPTSA